MAEKIIYAISDSLGETAEAVARATASQYDKEQIEIVRIPYIEDEAQIDEIIADAKNGNHVICHTIVGSLSNVGVFTLRAFFGTNHMYGWCHSFCSKV
ncbi:kinase/pyrophosphorylase, partial [Veillonella tobetsuensis]|uniref:kinase/pyrophosphorylase n=1 Tax=Veillonella tobetsuensis TaxID=1110546 RepID=UPI000A5056D6